jgi:hypothetical protein
MGPKLAYCYQVRLFRGAAVVSFMSLQAKKDGFAPSLALATFSDPASSHWTPVRPSSQVVHRLVALARKSLNCIQVNPPPFLETDDFWASTGMHKFQSFPRVQI